MADRNESKYFSSTLRSNLKRSVSDYPSSTLTLNDFYPCKKLRKLTPDAKLGYGSPDINRLSEQLRQKRFFHKKESPLAKKSLFNDNNKSKPNHKDVLQPSASNDVVIPRDVSPGGTTRDRIRLRTPQELPTRFQSVFNFRFFNIMQSSVFDMIINANHSLVVSSPTGSGKTVIFDLAIIREIQENPSGLRGKIIYLAPIKALITEKFVEWKAKFEKFGISILEYTGDFMGNDDRQIMSHDLILTTPEKWDVASRRKTHQIYPSLVMIDEVHLLSDVDRGHTLEAIVCRIKLIHGNNVRFVAVSATIPNGEDIAEWLNKGKYAFFDENKRPVPLKKIVYGYPKNSGTNDFLFEMRLSYKLGNLIRKYSSGKPTLIFTNTRKSAQTTANIVAKDLHLGIVDHLSYYAKNISDQKLKDLIPKGIGYHHAGLEPQDRKLVEQLFAQGDLPILTCTTTLAQGVNLPAHLVIIKGTSQLIAGATKEYDQAQVQQMIGRAGRPQFDTSATALILTKTSTQRFYEKLMSGNHCIESCLHTKLAEHLNAEIVLKNIKSKDEAIKWAKITYFFVRIFKNPKLYNLGENNHENTERRFEEFILNTLDELHGINIIHCNASSGALSSNIIGGVMARFNIAFKTMKNLNDTTGEEDIPGILSLFSLSEEYSNFVLRRNEKEVLNNLNKPGKQSGVLRGIKYPFQSKIKTPSMKISVLIQASFDCLQISDAALSREASMCIHVGQRISKAFMELLWNSPQTNKGFLLKNAIILAQCFQSGLWEDSPYVTKQFSRIGITYSTLLAQAGFTSFDKILSSNARSIELATNRPPPFGNHVIHSTSKMPKYEIRFHDDGKVLIDLVNQSAEELIQDHVIFVIAFKMEANKTILVAQQRLSDSKLPFILYFSKTQLVGTSELHVKLMSSTFCGLDLYECLPLHDSYASANLPQINQKNSQKKSSELNQSFIDIDTMKVVKTPRSVRKKLPNAITFDIDFDESMPDWDNDHLLQEMIKSRDMNFNKQNSINLSISMDSTLSTKSMSNVSIVNIESTSNNSDSRLSTSMMETSEINELDNSPIKKMEKSPYFQSKIFMDISLEKRLGFI